MGHRLSRIYTRTGDDGSTGLGDGRRVSKDAPRIACGGDADELNSTLGLLLASVDLEPELQAMLEEIQHDLFDLGGELCLPGSAILADEDVARLEDWLDRLNGDLPPLKNFVLPGGGEAAARCHLARAICRRCERGAVALSREEPLRPVLLHYLNRLSDLLFVMARQLARQAQGSETLWHPRRPPTPVA